MDMHRAFLAIALSFLIMLGYDYLFMRPARQAALEQQTVEQQAAERKADGQQVGEPVGVSRQEPQATSSQGESPSSTTSRTQVVNREAELLAEAREIVVDTPLYSAVINEYGGGIKSFLLKDFKREVTEGSPPMQLVKTTVPSELPLLFSLDNGEGQILPLYRAEQDRVVVKENERRVTLKMTADYSKNISIIRTMTFDSDSYMIEQSYQVINYGEDQYQIFPAISLTNRPFAEKNTASRYMFSGPVAFISDQLHEVKGDKLEDGDKILNGNVQWAAYEDNYFLCSIIPLQGMNNTVTMHLAGESVRSLVSAGLKSIGPGETVEYNYSVFFGPKKFTLLKAADENLSKVINFGWFDLIAKPMLWLLNFFHAFLGNYGLAVILLTVVIKLSFWPIAQKGMKSMKNMQKLQPKVAKLKEKFKDDPQRMNQEMMSLYKSYKVNPLGGCLPMFLQIPFFFALYKVLLMSIELRHAPFMLWINDLSAPDRLWVGFDIPFLHGIPVLTLLMGLSMYFQQKMTPTTADPAQAKIMQMLPVIFTFMFLNFASGLVLYWFVNNLLSMLQQYLINRQTKTASA
ncbi:MAG: membrane protein insertase YidC [Desulfobulbaceae bacterium]|nr:membrane protein insertase YidC [Desulfobulbaceae bacterium]